MLTLKKGTSKCSRCIFLLRYNNIKSPFIERTVGVFVVRTEVVRGKKRIISVRLLRM